MDTEPVRGTRDFLPQEKLLRDYAKAKLASVFERFGYNPIETPAFENWEILASKYAGGAEILKETYRFSDQGGRDIGLRYDQTVPTCRVFANNPRLPIPFKRYQIQPVWRDGPIKLGRYREFYQCDFDIFGVQGQSADAETIAVIQAVYEEFGFKGKLKLNNRKILNGLLELCDVKKEETMPVILSVDKLEKIGAEEVAKEMEGRGVPPATAKKVLKLFFELDSLGNGKVMPRLKELLKSGEGLEGVKEMEELLDYLDIYGVNSGFYEIKTTLARGLTYYNSAIYEGYIDGSPIKSSICGCGRYDNMVGEFAGKGKVPATGGSFGFEVICEALKLRGEKVRKSVVEAFVIPVKGREEAFAAASKLRGLGVNASIDLLERSVSKNLEFCSKQEIPFAVIVGEKEAKAGKVTLRDMKSGEEKMLEAEEAAEKIKRQA
jgi:histidyl-tRNA synthetase